MEESESRSIVAKAARQPLNHLLPLKNQFQLLSPGRTLLIPGKCFQPNQTGEKRWLLSSATCSHGFLHGSQTAGTAAAAEATWPSGYLWWRRTASSQALQLFWGEEIWAARWAAQSLHQGGDDAAATATHPPAHQQLCGEERRSYFLFPTASRSPQAGFLFCTVLHMVLIHRYSYTDVSASTNYRPLIWRL